MPLTTRHSALVTRHSSLGTRHFPMIDIHTHIIPALDDGPTDMDVSVAMGEIAAQEGTKVLISTSHSAEAGAVGYEGMLARLAEVRAAWASAGIDIRLELGVEVFLDYETVESLRSGKLWTLAGSQYVLVEVPYTPWPAYAERALFDLQTAGYTPILAHPERYTAVQDDPNLLYRLVQRGILAQVTSAALLGEQGEKVHRTAEVLVRHGLAQFLASDGHNVKTKRRMPLLREAVQAASHLIGEEAALALVTTNPSAVLENRAIEVAPEPVELRKSFLGGLFGGGTREG
ncbi:MAG TPA: CpsB/CapC family capsule biosynthesis tyrosine phosphatase [Chloroflexia bacterium]|nr:CpsB/CapC family capsule biosynthesis tyrosine phosphatase [Chloroflexia bacterium]